MEKFHNNLDFINEVYRNASVALQSISDLLAEDVNVEIKEELNKQYSGYESLINELTEYMKEKSYEIKDLAQMKKFFMASAVKMNVLFDGSSSHVAQIMIKGTVMGITELCKILNDTKRITDEKAIEFAKRLLSLEEKYEQSLKKFL